MRTRTALISAILAASSAAACGDNDDRTLEPVAGPYDAVPIGETLSAPGLSAPVDVVRDQYGISHIHAQTIADLGFASGYMQAYDRLQQMDLFRRFAAGTLSELFGALDPGQVNADLEIRMHRMRPIAEEMWQSLQGSDDPADQELVAYISRFTDGVNAYAQDLQAGRRQIDPAQALFFDPQRFAPWTPVDTLAIGRLQAFLLSYDYGWELAITDNMESARAAFDQADPASAPELARRAGTGLDLRALRPMDLISTIDGFPNVETDTGTRALTGPLQSTRPRAPSELLAAAQRALTPKTELGRRLRSRDNGSNNWVVSPALAGGVPLLANDPHLELASPSMFYLTHVTVGDDLDMAGITFPGIPGVILGHNRHVAWGSTTAYHDVTDYYLEETVPCSQGSGDCVRFQDGEVPIETWQETVQIGALGTITETRTVTYERVPHHGPIIPTIENGAITPRTGTSAISVRYTGHQPTLELRALQQLWRAKDRAEAMAALDHFSYGAQSWVFIDSAGSIGWSSAAMVPTRTAGCFTFHAETAPDGVAPFMLLPGDGSCEWDGWLDERYIPHAVDPERGFLVTANADLVGATFDGDITNEPEVNGKPLYVGALYAESLRTGRITRRLEAAIDAGALTVDDMAAIQADTHSNYGERMRPHLIAALSALAAEIAEAGTHPELSAFAASLGAERRAAMMDAAARVESWTLETPPAVMGTPGPAEITDSTATSIFNIWAVHFLAAALGDELERMGKAIETEHGRALLAMLERPGELHSGVAPETGQPVLCDDLDTAEIESCTLIMLMAMDQALTWASGAEGFATADMDEWRWGTLHTLRLAPLVPMDELVIPPANDPDPALRNGYPRPGDIHSVDAASAGIEDLDFRYGHGPAMRNVTQFTPEGRPVMRVALPGGQSSHRDSGHFRDLMDEYWARNQHFQVPWTVEEVVTTAETRWRFEPAN